MSMDWEYFFRYGFNPALQSLQDYQKFMRESALSQQTHKQRMKEYETGHKHQMKEMETRYGYQFGLTDYEMQWRERLAKVNANIERSLAMDKDLLQRNRIQFSHDLDMISKEKTFENTRSIVKMQTEGGLQRANIYKDIAKINSGLTNAMNYNPDAVGEVNLNTWNNLLQNRTMLTEEGQNIEMEIQQITNNPLFQKIHRGTLTESGMADWGDEEFSWYKEQLKLLEEREKVSKQIRTSLLLTDREVVKFATDAKIGNPVSLDMPEVQEFLTTQVGYPLPANLRKPNSQKGLDEHLGAIEELVLNNKDLPDDLAIMKNGYDVDWMKQNWPQYRDFYRNRMNQIFMKYSQETLGELSENMKKVGKFLSSFFF